MLNIKKLIEDVLDGSDNLNIRDIMFLSSVHNVGSFQLEAALDYCSHRRLQLLVSGGWVIKKKQKGKVYYQPSNKLIEYRVRPSSEMNGYLYLLNACSVSSGLKNVRLVYYVIYGLNKMAPKKWSDIDRKRTIGSRKSFGLTQEYGKLKECNSYKEWLEVTNNSSLSFISRFDDIEIWPSMELKSLCKQYLSDPYLPVVCKSYDLTNMAYYDIGELIKVLKMKSSFNDSCNLMHLCSIGRWLDFNNLLQEKKIKDYKNNSYDIDHIIDKFPSTKGVISSYIVWVISALLEFDGLTFEELVYLSMKSKFDNDKCIDNIYLLIAKGFLKLDKHMIQPSQNVLSDNESQRSIISTLLALRVGLQTSTDYLGKINYLLSIEKRTLLPAIEDDEYKVDQCSIEWLKNNNWIQMNSQQNSMRLGSRSLACLNPNKYRNTPRSAINYNQPSNRIPATARNIKEIPQLKGKVSIDLKKASEVLCAETRRASVSLVLVLAGIDILNDTPTASLSASLSKWLNGSLDRAVISAALRKLRDLNILKCCMLSEDFRVKCAANNENNYLELFRLMINNSKTTSLKDFIILSSVIDNSKFLTLNEIATITKMDFSYLGMRIKSNNLKPFLYLKKDNRTYVKANEKVFNTIKSNYHIEEKKVTSSKRSDISIYQTAIKLHQESNRCSVNLLYFIFLAAKNNGTYTKQFQNVSPFKYNNSRIIFSPSDKFKKHNAIEYIENNIIEDDGQAYKVWTLDDTWISKTLTNDYKLAEIIFNIIARADGRFNVRIYIIFHILVVGDYKLDINDVNLHNYYSPVSIYSSLKPFLLCGVLKKNKDIYFLNEEYVQRFKNI